jgi:hypothetical protein
MCQAILIARLLDFSVQFDLKMALVFLVVLSLGTRRGTIHAVAVRPNDSGWTRRHSRLKIQ